MDKTRQLKRVFDEFGAEILVSWTPREPLTMKDLVSSRARVIHRVESCTRCVLSETRDLACPYDRNALALSHRFLVAVVGEAPGPEEDKAGRPFVGRSGKVLRTTLRKVGLDPVTEVTYLNTVACFPQQPPPVPPGQIRAPSDSEMRACRTNLMDQLHAVDVRYVLLAGAKALSAWRKDLRITKVAGRWGVWDGRWMVMPVLHPAAVMRTKEWGPWENDLRAFAQGVYNDSGLDELSDRCVACGDRMEAWDSDGMPWCERHIVRGIDQAKGGRKWWKKNEGQQGLGI